MKEILFIKDTPANRISYYHLLLFLIALPFDQFYSELVLVSLLAHTLIHFDRKKIARKLFLSSLPVLLYILTIAGTLYSQHKQEAFNEWGKQLALILFPLIVYANEIDLSKYQFRLLNAFAFTCTVVVLYLFTDALRIIHYNHLPFSALLSASFTNHNFSSPIGLHATYFSMHVAFSFIIFLYHAIMSKKKMQQSLSAIACVILFAGLIQLTSLAVFIAFSILLLVFPFFVLHNGKRKIFFSFVAIFAMTFTFIALKTALFKDRFILKFKEDLSVNETSPGVSDPRGARWNCAMELIARKPVTGYGSGTETDLLKQKYFEHQLYNSYLHNLNAHNEYLSITLKTGMIGLIIYLFILIMAFKTAIEKKDIFFCSFLILATTISFSENILDVNKGIFFFAFFYSLFANRQLLHFSVPKLRAYFLHHYGKISK